MKKASINVHTRRFNLIHRKVELKDKVIVERDWYSLFNILVICICIIVSIIAFVIRLSLNSSVKNKTEQFAQKVNIELNTYPKEILKKKINVINDKNTLYKNLKGQNFDLNTFLTEVESIYPNIKVQKFTVQPDTVFVNLNITITTQGYSELPKFIDTLDNNERFKGYVINGVAFSYTNPSDNSRKSTSLVDSVKDSNNFLTSISLSIPKIAPTGGQFSK